MRSFIGPSRSQVSPCLYSHPGMHTCTIFLVQSMKEPQPDTGTMQIWAMHAQHLPTMAMSFSWGLILLPGSTMSPPHLRMTRLDTSAGLLPSRATLDLRWLTSGALRWKSQALFRRTGVTVPSGLLHQALLWTMCMHCELLCMLTVATCQASSK